VPDAGTPPSPTTGREGAGAAAPGGAGRLPPAAAPAGRGKGRRWRWLVRALLLLALVAVLFVVHDELRSSKRQARHLSEFARELSFELGPGPSPRVVAPPSGPYDQRLGYSGLPERIRRLEERGFSIVEQARVSAQLQDLAWLGVFPVYREKTQAGLRILDCNGREIFARSYPERVFRRFADIPSVAVGMLLFLENRELLDETRPFLNPAIEWDRLAKALLDRGHQVFVPAYPASGGSTLAIQLEKFQHSPAGVTGSVTEKLRQMTSASFRSYLAGRNTLNTRKEIVLKYVNSVPLAARADYGEINGLGDGLWGWYGADLRRVTETLNRLGAEEVPVAERSLALKRVLSLFVAHKKPTYFLIKHTDALNERCNAYLRLLAAEGIVPPALAEAAQGPPPVFCSGPIPQPPMTLMEKKAANSVRVRLLSLLGVEKLYDLDRMDLQVASTLDLPVQQAITRELLSFRDPARVAEAGLRGERLLDKGDLSKVVYSFTLYERTPQGNLLRVQTDNYDQPLNINEGVRLDLGSTAKLRTLVLYLEMVASMHGAYAGLTPGELERLQVSPKDRLRRWAVDYLGIARDRSLGAMLEAAMERTYSASPAERFFTGGGIHTFENFDPEEDDRTYTVREGFKHSVNLVFIRLMRDLVRAYMFDERRGLGSLLSDARHPDRKGYLSRFADYEGAKFLRDFYLKYREKPPEQMPDVLLAGVSKTPRRLAAAYRSAAPEADFETFRRALERHMTGPHPGVKTLEKLYREFAPGRFSLSDQGYLARVHPLELWTVAHLRQRPDAGWGQVLAESGEARQEVYRWLMRSKRKAAQDKRISIMLEIETFHEIHQAWQRLGFPFESIVPSYATAIGSSGDRPSALGELMGIVLNDGVRMATYRVEGLHFAAGTPYEVRLARSPGPGKRVMDPEIARVVRQALLAVVEDGTARRALHGFLRKDGSEIPVGGKTGTGDHRFDVFGSGGRLISSKVVNRTSTFVFFIGDRFYGTITAFVQGPGAAGYGFTSSLPVAVLKLLAPRLMPLIDPEGAPAGA